MLTKLIAFLTFLLFASASLKAFNQPRTDLDCPHCESSYCHSECLAIFSGCDVSCPCGLECELGCVDCEHPICERICENAQEENEEYKACLQKAQDNFIGCTKECPPDMSCHDSCYAIYQEELSDCPCIETQTTTTEVSTATTTTTELTPIDPIAKLNGCAFVELSARLNVDRDTYSEALSIQSGSQALICFNYAEYSKSCEIFDGSSAVTTFETTNTHGLGGLGFYQNQPATVGCGLNNHKKAETLTSTGWVALPDHPEALFGHSSIGLDDNSMMLLGGRIGSTYQTGIWKIKENVWSRIGELTQSATYGSAIYTGHSIYHFSGYPSPYPNHRIDLTEDEEIKEVVRIGNHASQYLYPVLLVTENNRCL
ncbi:unnamed protein product [Oikopleura dioica]|uniref:Uncharacterized protein n=1 Tax=Oikopleura dioica TaxID=34765 RepID=E4XIA9_OIKDI|nr:unnamed protein product [Oikopleura dioica]